MIRGISTSLPAPVDFMNFYMDKTKRVLLPHSSDKGRIVVQGNSFGPIPLKVGSRWFTITTDIDITTSDIDTGVVEAGKDYYIYACDNNSVLTFKFSLNSTYPAGFTAQTSRKIGGFHTLCVNVGTISGHPLSGYLAGNVLPASVWDLKFRAASLNNSGLVYDDRINKWVQIYLASDNGSNGVQSVYNATILDTTDWNAFVEKGGVSKLRLLKDDEFQITVRGSNEETNITGIADPVTTGGHIDSASRRMIGNIGLEDACGVEWQWLLDQSYRWDMELNAIEVRAASATTTVYHAASPGGNPVYLKFDGSGNPYLCCNMATAQADKVINFGTNAKIIIKHDANANTGYQVYMNRAATESGKILCNIANFTKNAYIKLSYPEWFIQIVHDANAASNGVAVSYDDGADNRLEATFDNSTNNSFDSCYFGPLYAAYNLAGTVGSLYRYGTYGDVKLLAGGAWNDGAHAGSRSRSSYYDRWITHSAIGGRFASAPL